MRKGPTGGLVYSTESGRMCPACRQPVAACTCRAAAAASAVGDGKVRVSRETQGRGGKVMTLVRGLPMDAAALERSAKGRSHGDAILENAAALGADMLVKGAYTQSRLRQMIFGGATSLILSKAAIPVFMSN